MFFNNLAVILTQTEITESVGINIMIIMTKNEKKIMHNNLLMFWFLHCRHYINLMILQTSLLINLHLIAFCIAFISILNISNKR